MKIITRLENKQIKENIPQFVPGDTLKVHIKVVEGGKERIQIFEGIVLRKQGGGLRETFTVRKISHSVGVEKTFPLHSPSISNIEVIRRGDVNRAKLYYLRKKVGRAARVKEKRF